MYGPEETVFQASWYVKCTPPGQQALVNTTSMIHNKSQHLCKRKEKMR